jgi:hypothetical protein
MTPGLGPKRECGSGMSLFNTMKDCEINNYKSFNFDEQGYPNSSGLRESKSYTSIKVGLLSTWGSL